ncbi:MAG: hypothetical protein HQK95_09740 [Nitrospirae bacterium]|nr:hypothetical protein [Nitrospirota bacterium]
MRECLTEQGVDDDLSDNQIAYLWILCLAPYDYRIDFDLDEDSFNQGIAALHKISKIINKELHAATARIQVKINNQTDDDQRAIKKWIDNGVLGFSAFIDKFHYDDDIYLLNFIQNALDDKTDGNESA